MLGWVPNRFILTLETKSCGARTMVSSIPKGYWMKELNIKFP